MSCRKSHGGGRRIFRECSLSLETFAEIAEWFLAEIQRKSSAENGFEAEQKDSVPVNCNLSASKMGLRESLHLSAEADVVTNGGDSQSKYKG